MHAADNALNQAVYRTIHENGGVKLAARLGMTPGLLLNKAHPRQRNQFSLTEAVHLQQITGDVRILHAMAAALGYVVTRIDDAPAPSDVELLTLYGRWNADTGAVHHEIADALDDQRITQDEQAEIEERFYAAARSGLVYLRRMGGLVQ